MVVRVQFAICVVALHAPVHSSSSLRFRLAPVEQPRGHVVSHKAKMERMSLADTIVINKGDPENLHLDSYVRPGFLFFWATSTPPPPPTFVQPPPCPRPLSTVTWPMNNKKSIGNHRGQRRRRKKIVGYTRIQVTVVWCPPPPPPPGGGDVEPSFGDSPPWGGGGGVAPGGGMDTGEGVTVYSLSRLLK